MTVDGFGIAGGIFIFSFGLSLNMALRFSHECNRFSYDFLNNLAYRKAINFDGPRFNYTLFFCLTGICSASMAGLYLAAAGNAPVQTVTFLIHYAAFAVWVVEHVFIVRREVFIDSLRVPWQP